MPLMLPVGLIPKQVYVETNFNYQLTRYRFEVLDRDENLLFPLAAVKKSGGLDFDAYASVKGGGSLEVTDLGQDVDWLNARIRPVAIISNGAAESETPLGVYTCSAPKEAWSATGRAWKVELLDKLAILDTDIALIEHNFDVTAYSLPAGTNVVFAIKALITGVGETSPAILDDPTTLTTSMTWELGTTRLRVINDLLNAINWFSLWVDGQGQYRTSPYIAPDDRVPVYDLLAPFVDGETSLMAPEWEHDQDYYSVPNRYVLISTGDETTEGLIGIATDDDPASPYSSVARGRYITQSETGVEANSQADIDAQAARKLSNARSVTSSVDVNHLFLPDLLVNSVVGFHAGGLDTRCAVIQTSIPFDPLELSSSLLRNVG